MRKWTSRIVLMVVMAMVVFGTAQSARAEEVEKSASAGVSYMNEYLWRGLTLSESTVIQPTVGMTYGNFGANLWSNYDSHTGEATETDLTLSYGMSFDKVGVSLGYIYYELDGFDDTQEFYAGVSYDAVVTPSLTLYYDTELGTGGFWVLAAAYSREISSMTLNASASASYLMKNGVMGLDENGEEFSALYNGELKMSLDVPVMEGVTVSPMVGYTMPLSDKAKDAITALTVGGDHSKFYGGVTATLGF